MIAHQNGKLGEAIEHLQRASSSRRGWRYSTPISARCSAAGRPKLAAEAARRALEIEPAMATALSNLGVALYELKDFEEAAAGASAGRSPRIRISPWRTAISATRFTRCERFDEAVAAYRHAIELQPDFADAWANLGTTLHHGGDFEEGMSALRHAIALAPITPTPVPGSAFSC